MCDRTASREGGFTLVELVIGFATLAVVVTGLIHTAVSTSAVRRIERERNAAWSAVSEQLRSVTSTPFANIVADHDGRGFAVRLEGSPGAALQSLPGLRPTYVDGEDSQEAEAEAEDVEKVEIANEGMVVFDRIGRLKRVAWIFM